MHANVDCWLFATPLLVCHTDSDAIFPLEHTTSEKCIAAK